MATLSAQFNGPLMAINGGKMETKTASRSVFGTLFVTLLYNRSKTDNKTRCLPGLWADREQQVRRGLSNIR